MRLAPGKSKAVRFKITPAMMELIDERGEAVLEPGASMVFIGGSCPDERSQELGAPKPARSRFELT